MNTEQIKNLAWLGGFIDGEGSFSMYYRKYSYILKSGKNAGKRNWYAGVQICFQISNTNFMGMAKTASIMDDILGDEITKIHLAKRKTTNGLDVWKISISGRTRMYPFLTAIIPFLVGKKREAELVKEWFDKTEPFERFDVDKFKPYHEKMKAWHANPSETVEANTSDVLQRDKDRVQTTLEIRREGSVSEPSAS